ncbi:MAG: hypothetical protein JSS86_04535 [Cyanobacteria bacterium SZAS LIN-2]|nr:hypothetical protein [Cyanobacteria bacterium SZAS LIN-2]
MSTTFENQHCPTDRGHDNGSDRNDNLSHCAGDAYTQQGHADYKAGCHSGRNSADHCLPSMTLEDNTRATDHNTTATDTNTAATDHNTTATDTNTTATDHNTSSTDANSTKLDAVTQALTDNTAALKAETAQESSMTSTLQRFEQDITNFMTYLETRFGSTPGSGSTGGGDNCDHHGDNPNSGNHGSNSGGPQIIENIYIINGNGNGSGSGFDNNGGSSHNYNPLEPWNMFGNNGGSSHNFNPFEPWNMFGNNNDNNNGSSNNFNPLDPFNLFGNNDSSNQNSNDNSGFNPFNPISMIEHPPLPIPTPGHISLTDPLEGILPKGIPTPQEVGNSIGIADPATVGSDLLKGNPIKVAEDITPDFLEPKNVIKSIGSIFGF